MKWGQTRNLGDRTFGPGNLSKRRPGSPNRLGAKIWGQTRCPMYRSGTFNVQRSTLNVQCGDRKGVLWPGNGDRQGIWTTGLLTRRTYPSAGRAVQAGCGTRIWGQAPNLDNRTPGPVDLPQRRRDDARRLWSPDMGTDTQFTGRPWHPDMGTLCPIFNGMTERVHGGRNMGTDTMSDIPIRNVQRPTFNAQRSMG